jgi:riboflavin biosynthesis pyrimidine reductase
MPRPHVICHMASSVDGRVKIKRWSRLDVEGTVEKAYEAVHDKLEGDAWICGRITMAGYAPGEPPKPYTGALIPREDFVARRDAKGYAIGLDAHARMHWGERNDITGDHVVMILTEQAPDAHLDALRNAGVSYLFGGRDAIDLCLVLDKLAATFSIKRLLLEGGGRINGAFLADGLVDEVSLLVAPAVDGLMGTPAVFDYEGHENAPKSMALTLRTLEAMDGGVVWLRYDVARR